MTKRDYLRELEKMGLLNTGIRLGVISPTSIIHAEYFDYWFSQISEQSKTSAVIDTSIKFNVSQQTIWTAIKSMRQQTPNPVKCSV